MKTSVKVILVLIIAYVGAIEMAAVDAPSSEGAGLFEEALKYGVEISKIALKRLSENIFGSGRAARSSDVAIFNKSGYKFKCMSSKCDYGGYTSSLLPEYELLPKECTLFGTESTSFFRGVGCTTKYESDDGTFFELTVDNPYNGKNSVIRSGSPNLILIDVVGAGNNNQVRLIIEDRNNNVFSASNSKPPTAQSITQTYDVHVLSESSTQTSAPSTAQTYDVVNTHVLSESSTQTSAPSTTHTYDVVNTHVLSESSTQTSAPSTAQTNDFINLIDAPNSQTPSEMALPSDIDETSTDINVRASVD